MDPSSSLLIAVMGSSMLVLLGALFYTTLEKAKVQRPTPASKLHLEVGRRYLDSNGKSVTIVRRDILQTCRADDYRTHQHLIYIGSDGHYYTDRGYALESYPGIPLPAPLNDLLREA